jgi:lipoprotein-anchoring transpeptidase ErfK/SrfK
MSGTTDAQAEMGPKQPLQQARSRRSNQRSRDSTQLIITSLVALSIAMMGLAAALALLYHSDLILPGVEALDVDLGGKTTAKAAVALQQNWERRLIVLYADDTTYAVTPAALGIILDGAATAQAAHQQARSLGSIEAMRRGEARLTVAPLWVVDRTIAEANLRALASQFDVPPVDAGIGVVNGGVEVIPPAPGRALDIAASVAWLEQHADRVVAEERLDLATAPVQPAIGDVSAAAAQASQLLANPLSIHAYDPITDETLAWTIPPDVWGTWLDVGIDAGDSTSLYWELDAQRAEAGMAAQMVMPSPDRDLDWPRAVVAVRDALAIPSWYVHLRVYHHQQQHTVAEGETLASIAYDHGIPYPWIQQANPGVGDALHVDQVLTIPSPDVFLPLPVVENKRIVVSLGEQKMRAYENGAIKWEWPVSTGIPSTPTSPGVFQIQSHDPNAYASSWDLWMPHFMGIYRPVPTSDFMNGFHGFPARGGSQLLWTSSLGRRVTYGCIMVSTENGAALYEWAEEGVVVEIQP